jgi:hypothetical protein
MRLFRIWVAAVAFSLIATLVPLAIANADCTTPGDFGAGAGCSPPGSSGSGNTESWPPTSMDWPPQLKSDSDNNSDKETEATSTPIVMPNGQKPPPVAATTSTSATPTPIVIPQH